MDKLAVLKDNVLYCEPITAELEVPKKKPKSGKSGKVKSSGSAQPTASTSSSTSRRRPSDPESADKDVVFPDPDQPSVLSTVVDVHAELYNLPSFQFLHQLLEYLYSEHGLLLRPVSNILLSFAVIVFLLWGFGWGFTGRRYRIMWSSGPWYKVVATGAAVVGSLSATFLVPSVLLLFVLLLIVNYAIFVLFIGLVLSFLLLP